MKANRLMLLAGVALLFAAAAFSSNPLPKDSMDAVRTMLRFAHANPRDTFTLDAVYVEPNFSMPEVFFGMVGIEGDWPVARRKAAFGAYLAVMADTDFSDETNNDRMLPIWATAFLDAVSVMVMRIRTKGGNISRMSGLARRATRPRL